MRSAICPIILLLLMTGCSGDPFWLPSAHKISIQQGNLLNEKQLAQVTLGMNREQVRSLIGTPIVAMPFEADRWDYLYMRGPAGSAVKARRISFWFEGDELTRIDDNLDLETGELPEKRYFWERVDTTTSDVPNQIDDMQ